MTDTPPRKLHIDDHDGRPILVTVDGVEQDGVLSYDIDAGQCVAFERDEHGYYFVRPGTQEAAIHTIHGVVTAEYI